MSASPLKKLKLDESIIDSKIIKRPYFKRVRNNVVQHQKAILDALDKLDSDWASFCFLKILNCNAGEACSFSQAYCKTERNLQDSDITKHRIVYFSDLFNFELVREFIKNPGELEDKISDKQLKVFEKLSCFLESAKDTNKVLREQLKDRTIKDSKWAAIFGIHVLSRLGDADEMKLDSGYSNELDDLQCPCHCKAPLKIGDNSMGHEAVWHGSVDILLGPVAVAAVKVAPEGEDIEDSAFDSELKLGKLEQSRHQLLAESIVFSCSKHSGVVPLVAISREEFKVFMYDPDEDLLYESAELPLFEFPLEGRQLHIPSIIALWLVINYSHFCTGVKDSHTSFGYKADLKKFLDVMKCNIYDKMITFGGLRHVDSDISEYKAGENTGKFERL